MKKLRKAFELTIPVNCEATLFLDNVISGIEHLTRKENGSFSLESGVEPKIKSPHSFVATEAMHQSILLFDCN